MGNHEPGSSTQWQAFLERRVRSVVASYEATLIHVTILIVVAADNCGATHWRLRGARCAFLVNSRSPTQDLLALLVAWVEVRRFLTSSQSLPITFGSKVAGLPIVSTSKISVSTSPRLKGRAAVGFTDTLAAHMRRAVIRSGNKPAGSNYLTRKLRFELARLYLLFRLILPKVA